MLSDADLSALSVALRRHKYITLVRTCSDKTVTVRTLLGGYPWKAEMLVQVRVQKTEGWLILWRLPFCKNWGG